MQNRSSPPAEVRPPQGKDEPEHPAGEAHAQHADVEDGGQAELLGLEVCGIAGDAGWDLGPGRHGRAPILSQRQEAVSYTHLRAHETSAHL
eukprot:5300572-Alexandrium_andersonii.AAC.1